MEPHFQVIKGKTIREFSDHPVASGTIEERLQVATLGVVHAERQLEVLEQAVERLLNKIAELNAELAAYQEGNNIGRGEF